VYPGTLLIFTAKKGGHSPGREKKLQQYRAQASRRKTWAGHTAVGTMDLDGKEWIVRRIGGRFTQKQGDHEYKSINGSRTEQ